MWGLTILTSHLPGKTVNELILVPEMVMGGQAAASARIQGKGIPRKDTWLGDTIEARKPTCKRVGVLVKIIHIDNP